MSSVVMSAGPSLFIVLNSYLEEFDTAHLKVLLMRNKQGEVKKGSRYDFIMTIGIAA